MVKQVQTLPVAPSRERPAQFSDEANDFLGALPNFGDEINEVAVEVNSKAEEAAVQVGLAADQVQLATTQAQLATTQVGLAADQVGLATTQANTASAAANRAESARDRAVQAEAAVEQALIDGPVLQVNGHTGDVVLSAADVGAEPADPGIVKTDAVQTLNNKTISDGVYAGVIDQTGSARSAVVAVAALNIDCSLGNYFTKTISANSSFTFSNAPSSRAYAFTLELTHTSGTVTWPISVQWPGSTAPALTTGKTHLFTFVTDDGGTRWRGVANLNYTN